MVLVHVGAHIEMHIGGEEGLHVFESKFFSGLKTCSSRGRSANCNNIVREHGIEAVVMPIFKTSKG